MVSMLASMQMTQLSSGSSTCGESICAAGSDQLICFYDKEGTQLQRFDYSHDEAEKSRCGSE